MKIASTVARYLLGLMFTVFGLNGFFHFIPQPPPESALAQQYFTVLSVSHYMVLVYLLQVAGGVLLLANRYVPLALVFLAPVLVNILLFHSLMDPKGIGPGLLATILWTLVYVGAREAFRGVFAGRPRSASV